MSDHPSQDTSTDHRSFSPSSSIVQIDAGKYYWIIAMALALAIGALCFAGMAWWVADKAEREARMGEYYINELDKAVASAGIKLPSGGYQQFKRDHQRRED